MICKEWLPLELDLQSHMLAIFNLKWVGEQLKNSYTTRRFLEEITKKKREDYFPLCTCMVMVTRGKDRGETGVVKHVIRSQNRLIVEGKNLVIGPKDTPMDLALEKTRDTKTRKGMLDLINLLFNFIGNI
ncbi:unnamed protein product [Camellia sinensis]